MARIRSTSAGVDGQAAQPGRLDLEQQAGGVDVRELGGGEVGDDRAAVRDPDDETVLLEAADRLADRHGAGAELGGEVAQPQP